MLSCMVRSVSTNISNRLNWINAIISYAVFTVYWASDRCDAHIAEILYTKLIWVMRVKWVTSFLRPHAKPSRQVLIIIHYFNIFKVAKQIMVDCALNSNFSYKLFYLGKTVRSLSDSLNSTEYFVEEVDGTISNLHRLLIIMIKSLTR